MGPFSAIGRSLLTRRVSARRQEAEDSREENGIPTPAIAANATNSTNREQEAFRSQRRLAHGLAFFVLFFLYLKLCPAVTLLPHALHISYEMSCLFLRAWIS